MVPVSVPAAVASARFEAFGPSHRGALLLLLVGVVVILLFGRRHRGTAVAEQVGRGLAVAVLAVTAVWAVSVFAFNVAAGTNYGYLNAKPSAASALDLLGPWPWYLLAEVAIVAAFWALITVPWATRAGAEHRRPQERVGS